MPRPRIVSAKNRQYEHVELSDGDWVNLKQKLNYGEASILYDATYRSNVGAAAQGTVREARMSEFNIQRILLYVLEWSFLDDENKPVPISAEMIRQLDPETAQEIHDAISNIEEKTTRAERATRSGNGATAAQPAEAPAPPPVLSTTSGD